MHEVKAVVLIPYFNLSVIQKTIGGDGSFEFNLSSYSVFSQDFRIETQQGAGSFFIPTTSGNGAFFNLSQNVRTGWKVVGISCQSDNPNVTFNYLSSEVKINAYSYSSVVCTFINVPSQDKTPVLIIPGVLGTQIGDGISNLWIDLDRMRLDIGDQFMDGLSFNGSLMPQGGIVGNIIRKAVGVPNFIVSYDYAEGLLSQLTQQGYTEGQDLFTFPYDWRYGVSGKNTNGEFVNEKALAEKIQAVRDSTGSDKVDVVAHSTGGLLVKQYVKDHPQTHGIGKAVFVGVPNTGAPKAVKVLLSGDNFGIPWLADEEMRKISQNLPVLYDLAPSRTYVDRKGSFFKTIEQKLLAKDVVIQHGYDGAWNTIVNDRGANGTALAGAESVHQVSFDDYDLRTAGVDLYNIAGCKAGTIGQIVERRSPNLFGSPDISYDAPVRVAGDGTVPLESATNVPVDADKKYYALKTDHGKMMSQDGIRQLITNIVSGSVLATPEITQDITACKLSGKAHAIYSPVDVEVTDASGNRLGLAEDGSVENTIPNASFELFGDHKFFFLPTDTNQQYDITLKGTDTGTFTYKVSEVESGTQTRTAVFADLPVTTSLHGVVEDELLVPKLVLDSNGDGVTDRVVLPSAVVTAAAQADLTAPVTTVKLTGTHGATDSYRSSTTVSLTAVDTGGDVPASGVARTYVSLDGADFSPYTGPIRVTAEGKHALALYSVDKNANRELTQQKEFWIDTTPPELGMIFDPTARDLSFSCIDVAGSVCEIKERDESVTLTDQAGNTTKVRFKQADRKKVLRAEVESVSYNGKKQSLAGNKFLFFWQLDRNNKITRLYQFASGRNAYYVLADYNGTHTTVTSVSREGVLRRGYPGLKLVRVATVAGTIVWTVE
ncbi:MAG: hypothetical protein KBD66_02470 [Candidatus Doudnabacteria bacterium]|nr:hypothetical protein [Candidatus Doudnabacteria bacterium]